MEAVVPEGAQQCCATTTESVDGAARTAVEGANASLAEYQRVRTWIVWPDLDFPRTATGKPRLSVIAARAAQILERRQDDVAESVGADFSPPSSSRSALDQLLERFSGTRGGCSRADSHLEQELNLSSLSRVVLFCALQYTFLVALIYTTVCDTNTLAHITRV